MFKKICLAAALLIALFPLSATVSAATPTSGNLIANPSMEVAAGAETPAGWTSGNWGTNTADFTLPTTGRTDASSLKTSVTAYTDGDAKWSFTPVTITPGTNYEYSHWYQSDVETEIDVQFVYPSAGVMPQTENCNTEELSCFDKLLTVPATAADEWRQAKVSFVAPKNVTAVTLFQPLAKVGYVQIDDADLHSFVPDGFAQAIVSLTFDDGWLDQYENARPMLNAHNMPATFYALSGILDGSYTGYMNGEQLITLQHEGHEIGSHTITHPDLSTLPLEAVDNELLTSRQALQALLGPDAAKNFAAPYGAYNADVLDKVKQYYGSHRSVEEGYNDKNFDIYNIKVKNILDSTTPQDVAEWVAQAVRDKTWLVLVYHRVTDVEPIEAEGETTDVEHYWTTPAYLNEELNIIAASGIAVKTVAQALADIKAQQDDTTPPPVTDQYPGDADGDKRVGLTDLQAVSVHWGTQNGATRREGDLDDDGDVDLYDLQIVSTNWGKQYE
ncbi:polysaccharide deacetylase family protein [Candidatus Saccharibacteria bacterium]|nr:polysaccharide deacetylase family protein [Candidatus Saccharibacteria bacterium]